MPYAKTWSEELVAEWLQLEGYLVETSLPLPAGPQGGRGEADVVGARIRQQTLEIYHIEVGTLPDGQAKNMRRIQNKYSPLKRNYIITYFSQRFNFPQSGNINYQKLWIVTHTAHTTAQAASQAGYTVVKIDDFVRGQVCSSISNWKNHPPFQKTRGKELMLPDSLWLLHVIDKFVC
jgi:hypothetical protein